MLLSSSPFSLFPHSPYKSNQKREKDKKCLSNCVFVIGWPLNEDILYLTLLYRHDNYWEHGQYASGTKQLNLRSQRYMAYLEYKEINNACINHQKRALLTPFFINLLLIEVKLFPQSSKFGSNILMFGEESDKLKKMHPEPNRTILIPITKNTILCEMA